MAAPAVAQFEQLQAIAKIIHLALRRIEHHTKNTGRRACRIFWRGTQLLPMGMARAAGKRWVQQLLDRILALQGRSQLAGCFVLRVVAQSGAGQGAQHQLHIVHAHPQPQAHMRQL